MSVRPIPMLTGIALVAGAFVIVASARGAVVAGVVGTLLVLMLFPLVLLASRSPRRALTALFGGALWTSILILCALFASQVFATVVALGH